MLLDPEPQGVKTPALEILLVEDNPADIRMTREAFVHVPVPHRLHVVDDGDSALAFMRRENPYTEAPAPDLVLLDLSLPRLPGHAVLAELRQVRKAKRIPVVVLTGSRAEEDRAKSFELDADEHICKPPTMTELSAELTFALKLASAKRG